MKKLLFALCLLAASICSAQTVISGVVLNDQVTVTFSATPAFDASKANMFSLTLTGNVTSSTLSNAFVGQQLGLEICQDATGSRTFVPPTNVAGFTTIPSTANVCTVQFFWFDGANAQPDRVGIINGVSYPPNPSTHSVPVVTAANVITYKVIPDCQDSAGNHINYTQSTDVWSCGTTVPSTLTNETLAGTTPVNRVRANQGTALTTAKVGTLTGWGTTATVSSVSGTDSAGTINISSSGTGQTINPFFVLTFADGTWTTAPLVMVNRADGFAPVAYCMVDSTTATTVTIGLSGTPVAGTTYTINFTTIGR
jgi:hypothetical protein